MLLAKNIIKSYGAIPVLHGIDINIVKGELVALLGASGVGKSTLLHILGTLDSPDKGSLIINEQEVAHLKGNALSKFRNKEIGFVFQFHHLLPEFTALENVCIPGWIAGRNKKEVESFAKELLEKTGVGHRMHHRPSQISGGEQQRVAIARALINQPALLLADEPTGNLDTQNSQSIIDLLKSLQEVNNQTIIIVTHNEEIAAQCDRKIVLFDGRIKQDLTFSEQL
jgi:lipoprotein-releasing system ATP-binding protein